ncbi:MAG: hypothetical protein ACR2NP_01025 [Pirellulaceae bacterium]
MTLDNATCLTQWQDIRFWRDLCPHLTVTTDQPLANLPSGQQHHPLRPDDWMRCKELIGVDGYFLYESWFRLKFIDRLADAFERLSEANLSPAFCFVYDEFWQLMRELDPLISDLVGDYWLLPAVWAWHVNANSQTAFPPHRDQVRQSAPDDEDHLDYLTIWIPLTDLDHLSSCMCVLPASADPDYDMGTNRVCVEDLQEIRCLQGPRGSVFCWTTGLVHWGTRQSELGQPRLSVGLCVQNPEAECFDPPPMDFERPLTLTQRLTLIGQQMINYSRDERPEMLELAELLVRLDPGRYRE